MRILELLLILSSCTLLLYAWFFKKSTRKVAMITCFLGVGVLAGQLIFEGFRWQLFIAYIITIILVVIILLRYSKKLPHIKIWKPFVHIFYSITFILIIFSTWLAIYLPVFNLPTPEGLYEVGTQTFHLIDQNRDEVLTEDKNDKRELMVQVWYPAQNIKENKQQSLFPKDQDVFEKYIRSYSKELNVPAFVFDYWRYIGTNSYENAEILSSKSPYPIVIISHGMGTSRVLHVSQAENLASQGFIVAVIDHTYSTTVTAFPDGRVTGFKTEGNVKDFYESSRQIGKIWTEDISFVITQLEELNSGKIQGGFKGRIDLNNIGMMGHSFGGATAFNAVHLNNKIKAGIDLDGSLYDLENINYRFKPFMFIQSEDFIVKRQELEDGGISDEDLKATGLSKDEFSKMKQGKQKEYNMIDQVLKHGGTMIVVEGTEHYNFTDLQLFSDIFSSLGMTGKIDGKRSAHIVNQYVLDFFNKHLKGTGGDLIREPNVNYPEVKF